MLTTPGPLLSSPGYELPKCYDPEPGVPWRRYLSFRTTIARWRSSIQRIACCQIPSRFLDTVKFPHPIGIVIGDGVRIGKDVRIYQNVTIGLLENTPSSEASDLYPTIGDDVIIYAGAVLAGAITVGAGAVIGANAVITKDVPPGSVAFGRNQIMSPGVENAGSSSRAAAQPAQMRVRG